MLTLTFRQLQPTTTGKKEIHEVLAETTALLSDLSGAQVIGRATPILGDLAWELRWQTHGSRDRLVIESTWHTQEGWILVDGTRAALPYDLYTAYWILGRQGAQAGFRWLAAWWEGTEDPILEELFFEDSATYYQDEHITAPGRMRMEGDLVIEWVRPSPRIMSRFIRFGEECRINWESLIVEDLMVDSPATYLEMRKGKQTVALCRVLRQLYLPGMEGYDPRSKQPGVEYEIESMEVHPDHLSSGYGSRLVEVVKNLKRPMATMDTYRRAEPFWQKMGFVHNPWRSGREDSNIFEWRPKRGTPKEITVGEG